MLKIDFLSGLICSVQSDVASIKALILCWSERRGMLLKSTAALLVESQALSGMAEIRSSGCLAFWQNLHFRRNLLESVKSSMYY